VRIRVPLSDDDYRPAAESPLAWRWTNARYNVLPADALAEIKSLAPVTARRACELVVQLINLREGFLLPEHFDSVSEVPADGDADTVRRWIAERLPDRNAPVIVAWPRWDYAAATTIGIFTEYWDDFCYPSSDDVLIWPPDDAWALYFQHEEVFYFGMRRR
jgi:hypothetical protein